MKIRIIQSARRPNRTADGQLACAYGRPWLDHFVPPIGTGRGCALCGCYPVNERKTTMRFFDQDKVGVYLDDIGHRVEKTKEGNEVKMVDLTLRVQPFTPELAVSLDPDVRSLLFNLTDATAKAKIKALHFNLTVPRQALNVHLLPDEPAGLSDRQFADVEISDVRARTEKGVDGFGLVFYASVGPLSAQELEYICNWHTTQRFITFQPQEPALNFDAADPPAEAEPARRVPRRNLRRPPVQAGDELRPGIHAEH